MPKLLLVKCDSNWADEFDIQGFAIYTEVAWKEYLRLVRTKIFNTFRDPTAEYGAHVANIGTNEQMGYEDFASYKKDFKIKVISAEDVKMLQSLFKVSINEGVDKPSSYGMFVYLDPYYDDCEW